MQPPHPKQKNSAFSLVEMLSVIAVIGIIAAIAVPNIGRINESSKEAVAKRNAQEIVSVYTAGKAAGVHWGDYPIDIMKAIRDGKIVEGGVFDGTFFGVRSISVEDASSASAYIEFTDEREFVYTGNSSEGNPMLTAQQIDDSASDGDTPISTSPDF